MALYRFGKHPPKKDYRTLRLTDYLTPTLAPAPAAYSALDAVNAKLGTTAADTGRLYPMFANDRYGDCVAAACFHASTIYHGLVGVRRVAAQSTVLKFYWHLTGGVDSGLNELDTLSYWRKHKEGGDRLTAFVSIDPKNHEHVRQAIHLFGGVLLGFQVQENCMSDFDAGREWTPGRLTNDGHAVIAGAYGTGGVAVLTWGAVQRGTWEWWDACVDEAYCLLPVQASQPGFAPGFDAAALVADLAAVTD